MATMTIRNLEDGLKHRLRVRAAKHQRSMEEEARNILRDALQAESPVRESLLRSIRSRIEPLGGIELDLPRRERIRTPPGVAT